MTTQERQLSDMLHRITPEPPRRVTVEDVAFRLAGQAARARGGRGGRGGEPRPQRWRFSGWNRGWAPVLAAASVVVVAGASAGIAVGLTSQHGRATGTGSVVSPSSASPPVSSSQSPVAPSQGPASTEPTWPPEPVAGRMWGAELINRQTFTPGTLTAGAGWLYALAPGYLDRINPVTGNVLAGVPYSSPIPGYPSRPAVTGNTVWALASYSGASIVLHGYDSRTLAQVATVTVPASGPVSGTPEGVLTAGSDGYLYLAAGRGVAVVNPATRQVVKQISVPGQVNSVAVFPGAQELAVAVGSFQLMTYNPVTGARLGTSAMAGIGSSGGNLVATSGGVWGTIGAGMAEWVWFAPGADLTKVVRVSQGAGAGLDSVPTFSGGTVWIGGSVKLVCADPATGRVLASAAIPTDNGVVEQFGDVTVAVGGRTYALYQNQAARQAGVAVLTPPGACSG